MNLSPEREWNLKLGVILTLLTFGLGVLYATWQANRPLESHFVPNLEQETVDIETTNVSTTTYRGVRATFSVKERHSPSDMVCGAPIAVDTIVFTDADYDRRRGSYSKSISYLRIPANDHATFRVFIIKPEHKGWAYVGCLTIEYGSRENPQSFIEQDFPVLVTDRDPERD